MLHYLVNADDDPQFIDLFSSKLFFWPYNLNELIASKLIVCFNYLILNQMRFRKKVESGLSQVFENGSFLTCF